jgi:hypothetical protein
MLYGKAQINQFMLMNQQKVTHGLFDLRLKHQLSRLAQG